MNSVYAFGANIRKVMSGLLLLVPGVLIAWWFTASWMWCAETAGACGEGSTGPWWAHFGIAVLAIAVLLVGLAAVGWALAKIVPVLIAFAREPWHQAIGTNRSDDDKPSTF